jgi:hypothetical protein
MILRTGRLPDLIIAGQHSSLTGSIIMCPVRDAINQSSKVQIFLPDIN